MISRQSALSRAVFLASLLTLGAAPALAQGIVDDRPVSPELHVPGDHATIQAAIDAAPAGARITVGDGLWQGDGNRNLDFGGKDLIVRSANGAAHCVIDCQGVVTSPQRAFVFSTGETRASAVQGFTITGGTTEDGAVNDRFNGGAIRIVNASPRILDCIFENNYAGCWGAAVYAGSNASPRIERCLFIDNYANDDGGGFFAWSHDSVEIVRSAFVNNSARVTGGAISDFGGVSLVLENVTMVGNQAPFGSALFAGSDTILRNSIVWDNPAQNQVLYDSSGRLDVHNSIVEGGFPGDNNIDANPRFAADGFHLLVGSPALDGSWDSILEVSMDDFEGQRPFGGVDLGADEFTPRVDSRGSTPPGSIPGVRR
jgi:hypothetical protein